MEPKLDQIDLFVRSARISSAKIYRQKYGFTLRVFKISAVKEILANILPTSFLKREQASTALDYLNGNITGDELIVLFNTEYELGKRRSRPPAVSVPYTKLEARKRHRS